MKIYFKNTGKVVFKAIRNRKKMGLGRPGRRYPSTKLRDRY